MYYIHMKFYENCLIKEKHQRKCVHVRRVVDIAYHRSKTKTTADGQRR